MLKRFFLTISLAALCAALATAQQTTVRMPVTATHANDGKQMFTSYCAPCHGLDGRGHGRTAAELKFAPADLSVLSRNHHGAYPAEHLVAVLQLGSQNHALGSDEMPVWGPIFIKMDQPAGNAPNMEALRISNLVHYVETLQAK